MMNALIATDLDRTVIYSRAALELGAAESGGPARAEAEDLLCVEVHEGRPLSYVTSAAEAILVHLTTRSVVVPTTTRSITQFQRIDLPGAPWRYAITSNGGNILADGVPDPRWRSAVRAAIEAGGAGLDEVSAELARRIDESWVRTFRVADELFLYLVVDLDALPSGFLADWGPWCADRGWGVSQQGRKIYTVPDAVCKSRAVAEVRARLVEEGALAPGAPVLAAGDGALDASMLSAADAAIRPRHGELESVHWHTPMLTVTASRGIAAGEEILRWFSEQVEAGAARGGP